MSGHVACRRRQQQQNGQGLRGRAGQGWAGSWRFRLRPHTIYSPVIVMWKAPQGTVSFLASGSSGPAESRMAYLRRCLGVCPTAGASRPSSAAEANNSAAGLRHVDDGGATAWWGGMCIAAGAGWLRLHGRWQVGRATANWGQCPQRQSVCERQSSGAAEAAAVHLAFIIPSIFQIRLHSNLRRRMPIVICVGWQNSGPLKVSWRDDARQVVVVRGRGAWCAPGCSG